MADTRELIDKISALRNRLERAQGVTDEIGEVVAQLTGGEYTVSDLAHLVRVGSEHDRAVDAALAEVVADQPAPPKIPHQLTARARFILDRGKDLLGQLRTMDSTFGSDQDDLTKNEHPLMILYRRLIALTTTAIRVITTLPDSATSQLPLCDGPEAILDIVQARLGTLRACIDRRTHEEGLVRRHASILRELEQGKLTDLAPVWDLTEQLLQEIENDFDLRWATACDESMEQRVAAHSLVVARVAARISRYHPEFRQRTPDVVLAALLQDVGMLRVPDNILSTEGTLDDEQLRIVESHCRLGADMLAPLAGDDVWLVDVARTHHERLDGTGYPDGVRDYQISALARFLAVCDCYTALCSARPHRSAQDTRTALTDTLLMAEQGLLDQECAQLLLHLSFYPVGSVVELADGSVGVVTATPSVRRETLNPARPVVSLLLSGDGSPCPTPRHVDLTHQEGYSIVRSLPRKERTQRLRETHPEWAA